MEIRLPPDENMAFPSLPGLNKTLGESHVDGWLPQNSSMEQSSSTLTSLSAWDLLDKVTENIQLTQD